jgi:hypothetical protein
MEGLNHELREKGIVALILLLLDWGRNRMDG